MSSDASAMYDDFETLQNTIEQIQNSIAANEDRRAQVQYSLSLPIETKENPTYRPGLRNEEQFLANRTKELQNSINGIKKQIKDLTLRNEERQLERFKTTLTEENNKFQDQFNMVVSEKQELLAQRERIANNAETRERVVEIQRTEHGDLGKIIAAGIIGAVIFG